MTTLSNAKNDHLPEFFLYSFGFSWLVWISMILFEPTAEAFLPLLFLGAFGPALAALFLVLRHGTADEKKEFLKSIIDFKRIKLKWYLVIFLIFPAILFIGFYVYSFFGREFPTWSDYLGGVESVRDFLMLLLIMLIGGPLAEEPGWRGFALDRLQKRFGAVAGSVILGGIWILWHLPLFFIEGTSQNQKGFGIAFWSWSLQLIVISLIFTLVYNNNRKSILAAILLHLMANMAYPLNLDPTGEMIFSGVRLLVAAGVILLLLRKKETLIASLHPQKA